MDQPPLQALDPVIDRNARDEPGGQQQRSEQRLRPPTKLIVETKDPFGRLVSRDERDVVKPAGPVRQHEQLVRAVTSELPDARITSAVKGQVKFVCRGYALVSAYEDGLQPAPGDRPTVPAAER